MVQNPSWLSFTEPFTDLGHSSEALPIPNFAHHMPWGQFHCSLSTSLVAYKMGQQRLPSSVLVSLQMIPQTACIRWILYKKTVIWHF